MAMGPNGGSVFADELVWNVVEEISNGFRIADGFISRLDLVAIGLMTKAEIEEQTLVAVD
jgi:hypothetical protein